jgi:hypothetical protein
MNLTEEAIEKTLQAAVDLSHAGIGNLNGNVTQLGKVIPEFQTLTKEELQAGKATDVVKAKFKGFAASWSEETCEGWRNDSGTSSMT